MHAFIRYADRENAYWTGYFTSRPALKGYVRTMSAYYLVRLICLLNCFIIKEKKKKMHDAPFVK